MASCRANIVNIQPSRPARQTGLAVAVVAGKPPTKQSGQIEWSLGRPRFGPKSHIGGQEGRKEGSDFCQLAWLAGDTPTARRPGDRLSRRLGGFGWRNNELHAGPNKRRLDTFMAQSASQELARASGLWRGLTFRGGRPAITVNSLVNNQAPSPVQIKSPTEEFVRPQPRRRQRRRRPRQLSSSKLVLSVARPPVRGLSSWRAAFRAGGLVASGEKSRPPSRASSDLPWTSGGAGLGARSAPVW